MAEDGIQTNDYENVAYEGNAEEDAKDSNDTPDYENVNAVTVEPDDVEVVEVGEDEEDTLERRQERERLYFDREGKRLRVDYILTYQDTENTDKITMRESFQASLEDAGLIVDLEDKSQSTDLKTYYLKIHATWPALASGAELMNINKRLKTYGTKRDEDDEEMCSCCTSPFEVSEDIVKSEGDFFTAAFSKDHLHWFEIDEDNKEDFFTNSERSLITKEFLDRTSFSSEHEEKMKYGIHKLMRAGIYLDAFPLHEGRYTPLKGDEHPFKGDDKDRARLYEAWARPGRMFYYQPLDMIRKYFGEKIGIYFAWLGFYTAMLIPAALVGLVVFIYGVVILFSDIPSQDVCNSNMTMCPQCDVSCRYWELKESCLYSKLAVLFDNAGTVFFAIFMAIWASMFLEFWKRQEMELGYDWDVDAYETEERMRPEFEFKVTKTKQNPVTDEHEPYMPWYQTLPRSCTSLTIIIFFIVLVVVAIFGVIIYRMVIVVIFYNVPVTWVSGWAEIFTSLTAAVINLIIIMILNVIYKIIAEWLTNLESHRTETEYEDAFTMKMFLFQFINFYGSLFYIAYFKGSFIVRPGLREHYLFNRYRTEACKPSGCLIELSIQLFVVMIGKQVLNNVKELGIPWLMTCIRSRKSKKKETEDNLYMRWEQDKDLASSPPLGLFEEYLEMVIQYGFVTLFVAAFPLAPLFALLNNVIEIRLDAYKFVCVWRREPAWKAQDIGAWYSILEGLTFIAVLTNAFIIGWTSEFIPKLVYIFVENPKGNLVGFVENHMAYFNVSDFDNTTQPTDTTMKGSDEIITVCRYSDYREPYWSDNKYEYTMQYWHVFAARLAFVIVFEHAIFLLRWMVATAIPDVSSRVKQLQVYERQLIKKQRFDATFNKTEKRDTAAATAEGFGQTSRNENGIEL